MRLRANRSRLDATVLAVRRCLDGFGADLDLRVHRCVAMPPDDDFIAAEPGARLAAFVPVPEAIAAGQRYRFEARVSGGPQGERVVLTQPKSLPDPGPEPDEAG
jgi:hypothetical protein